MDIVLGQSQDCHDSGELPFRLRLTARRLGADGPSGVDVPLSAFLHQLLPQRIPRRRRRRLVSATCWWGGESWGVSSSPGVNPALQGVQQWPRIHEQKNSKVSNG